MNPSMVHCRFSLQQVCRFEVNPARVAKPLMPWLITNGSLTAQFEQLAGKPLYVERLFEGYRLLSQQQSVFLSLPYRQMAWIRQSYLYGDDLQPWVKAQSIFPVSGLSGRARRLRYLGKTPLGYVLFDREKPECRRIITTNQPKQTSELRFGLTRKNIYRWYNDHVFLVEETFLPAFYRRLISSG